MNLLLSLEENAMRSPDKTALAFFDNETCFSSNYLTISYQEFVQKAYAVAEYLMGCGLTPGERILIILPQSLDYLVAFYGCLYAQLIAVSLFPPKGQNHVHRVNTVIADAKAAGVIADKNSFAILDSAKVQSIEKKAILYLDVAEVFAYGAVKKPFMMPNIASTALAYLQYTSGSTGSPKGVMVSYVNLMVNLDIQQQAFNTDDTTSIVSWLPFSHDMGLIATPLATLHWGASAYITTPLCFIRQPKLWLDAISKFRGTLSWAPDFAYDLCVKKISEENRQGLDLSSWQTAVNASEPVRVNTIQSFIAAYQKYGFNPEAMKSAYGLAEATLVVTATTHAEKLYHEVLDSSLLQVEKIATLATPETSMTIRNVSNGKGFANSTVFIVDSDSHQVLATRSIGEIWVTGSHVCGGYWERPEINKEIFTAYTTQGMGPCLRTGDMGYLNEKGDLFIIGRLKDIIIIRGKNYSAVDIEQTVEASSEKIKENFVAAFAVDKNEQEQLIVLIEQRNPLTQAEASQIIAQIQKQLRVEQGIMADDIVFVGRGGLLKTTSGKLQRQFYKNNYLVGKLPLFSYNEE